MTVRTAVIECDDCGSEFEGAWDVESVQDMDGSPVQDQQCGCGHFMRDVEWPGWVSYTEAG